MLIVRRAKIVLYSLWYHHTETSEWSKITKIIKIIKIQFYKYEHMVVKFTTMCSYLQNCILIILVILDHSLVSVWWYQRLYNTIFALLTMSTQCSKHVEAWNKLIIKFSVSSWLILRNKYIEMHGKQNIKITPNTRHLWFSLNVHTFHTHKQQFQLYVFTPKLTLLGRRQGAGGMAEFEGVTKTSSTLIHSYFFVVIRIFHYLFSKRFKL